MLTAETGKRIRNAIEEAVYVVLGGPTKASNALGCSNSAVHSLLSSGMVQVRDAALRIEEATRSAGCMVPATELMALVPWRGPERHPDRVATGETLTVASRRSAATAAASDVPTPAARQREPRVLSTIRRRHVGKNV